MKASKIKAFSILALFLLGMMSMAVSAINIDPSTIKVKINGHEVTSNGGETLSINRGEKIEIDAVFIANGNQSGIELHAIIAGYEYGDRESLSAQTSLFDVEAGIKYPMDLSIQLPDRLDKDTYNLRLLFMDRSGPIMTSDYVLKVGTERQQITIKDVTLSPEDSVQAGQFMEAKVKIFNSGQKDQESIKVRVSVPDLGIAETYYMQDLESEKQEITEPLSMRIPKCAASGTYTVLVEATYDEGYSTETAKKTITVTQGDSCEIVSKKGIKVTVPSSAQAVNAGEKVLFPVTVQNLGKDAKQVTVSAQAGSAMTVSVKEPVVILSGEETKVVIVEATATEDAAGEQVINLKVGTGDNTQDITLKANVTATDNTWDKVKKGLEIGLVILVVLLVILGLIIGFNRLKGNEDEESEEKAQTYY